MTTTPAELPPRPPHRKVLGDRFVGIFVTVTLVLFAVLVGLFVYLVFKVSADQNASQQNTITSCQLANGNRSEDVTVLHSILALPAIADPQFITPASRAAQDAALAKVHAQITKAYALHDCQQQYSTSK
jgi:heme/copper-type cytochrome/quinol oxidase subunit 2